MKAPFVCAAFLGSTVEKPEKVLIRIPTGPPGLFASRKLSVEFM